MRARVLNPYSTPMTVPSTISGGPVLVSMDIQFRKKINEGN